MFETVAYRPGGQVSL